MTQKWLCHVQQSKEPMFIPHILPRPKFSSVSLHDEVFSSYAPILRKMDWMTPQITLIFSRSKMSKTRPKFHPFHSRVNRFLVTVQFWEICTEWPQTDLDVFKVKTSTHVLAAHKTRPKLSFISLYDELLHSYRIILKVHWMTPHRHGHIQCYMPLRPNYLALWSAVFDLQSNSEKRAPNDSKMTLTSSRSTVPMCIPYMH